MDDYDVFTDEIQYTKPVFKNTVHKYVRDIPTTPNTPNYECGRKLLAEESLENNNEVEAAFHFSESVSAWLRTMCVYREEQLKAAGDKLLNIKKFIEPVKHLVDTTNISKVDKKLLDALPYNTDTVTSVLNSINVKEDIPFHRQYLRFSSVNNVDNFTKILKELPKEWTIIQLTTPYNANSNIKQLQEYRADINSIYLSLYTNDYLDESGIGPITVNIPANVTKEGEKPLFVELYSLLEDNYKTIDNAQFLNNKRLVQNYWSRREDIDLRMKSVINVMDKEWLGGWGSLLTGRLIDKSLRDRVKKAVDNTISDWGFIRLTNKQKVLLYNLIECCPVLFSQQIKSCIRRILTENCNPDDFRLVLNTSDCQSCTKEFRFLNELCLKCLSKCFEAVHHFTLVDAIKAFSQLAAQIKDGDEWAGLKKAKRQPVVLIVDEMLDTFPWETLPILNQHPVSRIENIHSLYFIYKLHEDRVVNGYFEAKSEVGRYVINPEKNLDRMEKRMSSFVQYWCPGWQGHVGEAPPPEQLLQYLTEADLFLYCGHGDGVQLCGRGAGVEAAATKAVQLLAGCGSTRVALSSARGPSHASHYRLRVAGCPMIIGMLWEVTDLEVDKMVTTLVSTCVPSDQPPWHNVGKAKWSQGILDTNVEAKASCTPEADLLRAVSRSRSSTNYVMIASSMVARGLPLKIMTG